MLVGCVLKSLVFRTVLIVLLRHFLFGTPELTLVGANANESSDRPAAYSTGVPPALIKEIRGPAVGVGDICLGDHCEYYHENKDESQIIEKSSYYSNPSKVTRFVCIFLSDDTITREKEADSFFQRLNEFTEASELPFSFVEFYEKLGVLVLDVRSAIRDYEERSIIPLVEGLRFIRKLDILNKADCTSDSLLSEQSVFTSGNATRPRESSHKLNLSSTINGFGAPNRLLKSEESRANTTVTSSTNQDTEHLTDEAKLYKELDGYFLKKFNEASNLLNRLNIFPSGTNSPNEAVSTLTGGKQSSVLNALSLLSSLSNREEKAKLASAQEPDDPIFAKMDPKDAGSKLTISPLYLLGVNLKGKNITELSQKFKNQTSPIIPVDMSKEDISLDKDLAMNIATVIFKGMSDSSSKLPPPFGNPSTGDEHRDYNGQNYNGYGRRPNVSSSPGDNYDSYYPAISSWSYKPIPQGNNNIVGGFESYSYQPNTQSDSFRGGSFHPSSGSGGISSIDGQIVGFNNPPQGTSLNSNPIKGGGVHSQSGSGLAPSIFESIDTWGKKAQSPQSAPSSSSPTQIYYGPSNMKSVGQSIAGSNGKNGPDLKVPSTSSPTTSEWMRKTISKQAETGIKQPSFASSQVNQTESVRAGGGLSQGSSPIVSSNGNYFNSPLSQLSRLSNSPFHGNSAGTTYVKMNGSIFDDPNDITSFHPEDFINRLPDQVQKNMTQSQRDKINLINAFIGTGFDTILQMNHIDTTHGYGSQTSDLFRSLPPKRRLFEADSTTRGAPALANKGAEEQNMSEQAAREYEMYAKLLSNIDTNQGQDTAMAYVTGCDCDLFPEGIACPMVLSGEASIECIGYKVWNSARKGAPLSEVASAIDSAIFSKARNIILPLKFDSKTIEENRAAPRILRHIMRRTSKENGILFALPTGNNGRQELDGSLDFPCDDLSGMYAFCVGSVSGKSGVPSSFSNTPQLNSAIYAKGEDVESIGINQQRQLFSGTGMALAQSIGALNIIQGITKDKTSSFDQLAILYSAPKRLPSRNFLEQLFANSSPISFRLQPQLNLPVQFGQDLKNGTSPTDEIFMFGMETEANPKPASESSFSSHERNMNSSLMSSMDKDLDAIMARIESIENSLMKSSGFNASSLPKGDSPEGNPLHSSAVGDELDHNSMKPSQSGIDNTTIGIQISDPTTKTNATAPSSSTTTSSPSSKVQSSESVGFKESNYNPEIIGVVLDPREVTKVSRLVHSSNEYYREHYQGNESLNDSQEYFDDDGYRQYYVDVEEGAHQSHRDMYNPGEDVPKSLCYEEETRFYSSLEMAIPVESIEQCILSCSNTPDCRYYSYGAFLKGPNSIIGTCILMPDKQGSVSLSNFQSGALGCPVSASIAYAKSMEERLIQGISGVQGNNLDSSSAQVNSHLGADWPGILSTSTVAVRSMGGFLSRFPLNDILQTSISLYNSGFLDQKGALRPSGAFEKQSILPPPGVGSPHVVCTLQGMQCCVPQKSAKGWRKKPPSFLRVDDPSCEAIYVSKTDMFCATTSLYDSQDISPQEGYSSSGLGPKSSGNCGMVIIETSEHLIFQNTLKMPSKEMNNALCECKLNKRDKSIHGSGTWEYSVQAVQAAMSRKVEGDQLSSGVAQALAWVEAVGNDPNPAVNGLGELISQVAQRPNSDVELITQIPAISQNAVSNMLYNQQQQQIEEQEQIIQKQQSIQQYNNIRTLLTQMGSGADHKKLLDQFGQQCVTSWPEKCQVWKSKCEDNLIYGYKNPQCVPLTILEDGCPMRQVGFQVNQINPGILSFSFKPMKFSDNSPLRIACKFSLLKCSLANLTHKCRVKGNRTKKLKSSTQDHAGHPSSNIRKHPNDFDRDKISQQNNDPNHLFKIPMNYLPFIPKDLGADDENIIAKYVRVHFPQAGQLSNITMVKLFNKETEREFAAKIIPIEEVPKNQTIEDVLVDEHSNFEYLGKVEILIQDDLHPNDDQIFTSYPISNPTNHTKTDTGNPPLPFSHLSRTNDDDDEHTQNKEPLLLDKYLPDLSGETFPEFKMDQISPPTEHTLKPTNEPNHHINNNSPPHPPDHTNKKQDNLDSEELEDLYYYGFESKNNNKQTKSQISDFIPFISPKNKKDKWEVQINKASAANAKYNSTLTCQMIIILTISCILQTLLILANN
ncbi:signal peptide-containing protein [Cryptosporidium canis]|uniref:subtilisin n=1 Tax=Cryptosporidium canis TaxID=195482 RepID=A0A9D5HWR6_9CRYT|nr:signal peptide-containing protein [Cryptosporidium canis]